jgi:hypothetical protein
MAVMTSIVWPKGRIRRLSLKIHPLGDIIPSLRRAVCSFGSWFGVKLEERKRIGGGIDCSAVFQTVRSAKVFPHATGSLEVCCPLQWMMATPFGSCRACNSLAMRSPLTTRVPHVVKKPLSFQMAA